jgi:hypothetical protein
MTNLEIIGGGAAAVIAAGAYLKWATMPVVGAYRLGREVGRAQGVPGKVAAAFGVGYRFGRKDRHQAQR